MTGGKFISELYLKQPGFTYSVCGIFTKHREVIRKFRETGNLKHLYKNELDKFCFSHDAVRTISDTILKDRSYEIARYRRYRGYQRALASMVYKFFDTKTRSGVSVNEQLAEKLHKLVIKKFKRRKVYARFKDNVWAVDLAE